LKKFYKHTINVPAEAIDTNGHVNNVYYIQWMQDAAVLHSEEATCTQLTESLGATWIIRTHKVEYLQPAFANDSITVLTWVSNFRKVRSLRKHKFIRTSDNATLAQGETDWIFIDKQTGRPCVIPPEVKNTFELVPEDQEP